VTGQSSVDDDVAALADRRYMNELAELPGVGRVSSQYTMKLVKGAA
jgi:hypothetical protein